VPLLYFFSLLRQRMHPEMTALSPANGYDIIVSDINADPVAVSTMMLLSDAAIKLVNWCVFGERIDVQACCPPGSHPGPALLVTLSFCATALPPHHKPLYCNHLTTTTSPLLCRSRCRAAAPAQVSNILLGVLPFLAPAAVLVFTLKLPNHSKAGKARLVTQASALLQPTFRVQRVVQLFSNTIHETTLVAVRVPPAEQPRTTSL